MVLKVSLNTGINRIRLEFKVALYSSVPYKLSVLIESDWNLKMNGVQILCMASHVLIESDWNLKQEVQLRCVTEY